MTPTVLCSRSSVGSKAWRRRFGVFWLSVLIVACLAAPWLTPYGPDEIGLRDRLAAPSWEHPFGTDDLGRDVLTRALFAGRVSLVAGGLAVAVAAVVGVPLGILAGWKAGKVDWLLSRGTDVVMAIPALLLAVALIAVSGPGLVNAMVGIGVVYSPRLFRMVRASVLGVRNQDYIEAARLGGSSGLHILRTHVLPNIRSSLLVQLGVLMTFAMLAEASLSFLGLGVLPPTPSWGNMLERAFREITRAPYLVYPPGVLIVLTCLSFNLIVDASTDEVFD